MNDHRAAVRIVWIGLVLFLFAGSVAAQEKSALFMAPSSTTRAQFFPAPP
jgi:hypothetical protein